MADTEGKSSQNSQTSSQFSQSDLPELLHQYYKRLFPYKYFVQWLSYGGGRLFWSNEVKLSIWSMYRFRQESSWVLFSKLCWLLIVPKTYFVHREFSFTLKDDVYVRYQSFADQQELEKEILKRNPYKIDIGAVFTHKASETVLAFLFYGRIKVHVISRLHHSLIAPFHMSFEFFQVWLFENLSAPRSKQNDKCPIPSPLATGYLHPTKPRSLEMLTISCPDSAGEETSRNK